MYLNASGNGKAISGFGPNNMLVSSQGASDAGEDFFFFLFFFFSGGVSAFTGCH